MPKCEIRWIDCRGIPTPDKRPAVAVAICTVDAIEKRFFICADHLESLIRGNAHHSKACTHKPTVWPWRHEPLPIVVCCTCGAVQTIEEAQALGWGKLRGKAQCSRACAEHVYSAAFVDRHYQEPATP